MKTWTIDSITYKRKVIGKGVILACRKYRSELSRTQKPCQVFDGEFRVSFQTPHKRDIRVFVPDYEITPGKMLTWLHYDDARSKTFETVIRIADVSGFAVLYDIVSEEERVFQRRKTRQSGVVLTKDSFGLKGNPFLL